MPKYQKLHNTYIFNVLIINLITIIFLGSIWILHEYWQYKDEVKTLKTEFVEDQKNTIKNEVENAIIYIDNINQDSENDLKLFLQKKTDEIFKIIKTVYLNQKAGQSDEEIQTTIKDILRKINFSNENNPIYILSENGKNVFNPIPNPKDSENINYSNLQNEFLLAKNKGEGLIMQHYKSTNAIVHKVSYVRYFKPYRWVIGSSINFNEYIESRQHDVILRLSHIRFGKHREGYIFANTQNGEPLLTNGTITIGQANNWELKDPFGIPIIQEQYNASQKPAGDFIYYSWRKIYTVQEKAYKIEKETSPKMSFIKGYQPWSWMIGAGFYMDDIDIEIAKKREVHFDTIKQHMLVISLSLIVSILVSLILVRIIESKIEFSFNKFINFFKNAAVSKAIIDLDDLSYQEFVDLAINANNMVEQRELAEQGFKHIVEVFPFPICLYSEKKISFLNTQWLDTIGYNLDDIPTLSRTLIKCFPEPEERKIIQHLSSADMQLGKLDNLFKVSCKDGQLRYMKLNFIEMKDKRSMITLEDYTYRKKVEDDLNSARLKAEESDSLKSAFLANMSHEIRTPMNAIIGFSDLLQNDNLPEEKRKKYLSHISRSSESLLNLINDILDISKIEAGELNIYISPGSLSDTLSSVDAEIKSIRSTMGKNNIEIVSTYGLTVESGIIKTDLLRLKQVLMNLLSNALKFTENGTIEYGCFLINSKTLKFYVKDKGIGIKPNNINEIFNRFIKIEDDKTHVFRGAGLGLAITRKLVEALGGTIWVESRYGEGSTFYFTLPYIQHHQPIQNFQKLNGIISKNRWKGKVALIAENEELNYLFIKEVLTNTGLETIWAKNGQQAIETCNNHPFDLLMMDIKMPDINGEMAIKQIKKLHPELPVIALSAFSYPEEHIHLIQAGFDLYIAKPINPNKLIEALRIVFK